MRLVASRVPRTPRTAGSGRLLAGAAALLLMAVTLVRTAWMSDDAFITLRVVDNLLHGHGLRWNVAERVQVATHPLWLSLLVPVNGLAGEAFYSTIALEIALELAALAVLLRTARAAWLGAALVVSLAASRAFVDYGTAGLEGPLLDLVLAGFVALLVRGPRLLPLALAASAIALTRLDALLLVAPALGAVALRDLRAARKHALRDLALGAAPIVAWAVSSLVYFGAPLPNTAYAKLGTGLGVAELVRQSGHYLAYTATQDAATLALLALAGGLALARGAPTARALVGGVLLYLAYVARIGGDFMAGRFFHAPLVVAIAAAATVEAASLARLPAAALAAATAAIHALALLGGGSPVASGANYGDVPDPPYTETHGITDERRYYYATTGLLPALRSTEPFPRHPFAAEGREWRAHRPATPPVKGGVGMRGYFAGPAVHIVDGFALTDAFLSRLPMELDEDGSFRIGHFRRRLPRGYKDSAADGANHLEDPALAALWDDIVLATRADLLAKGRSAAIMRLLLRPLPSAARAKQRSAPLDDPRTVAP